MGQGLNPKLSRSQTPKETKRRGDKITKTTSAEHYKRKAKRLQDQLTAVEAKLAATNVELSRLHKDPRWTLVPIDASGIQLWASCTDEKHCNRCNESFDKPSLLDTHPCWPGHPRESFPQEFGPVQSLSLTTPPAI